MKYVFSAETWFPKTSNKIMKYDHESLNRTLIQSTEYKIQNS